MARSTIDERHFFDQNFPGSIAFANEPHLKTRDDSPMSSNYNDDHDGSPSPVGGAGQDEINFGDPRELMRTRSQEYDLEEDEEVLQLAARLAPAFEEAHDLFQVPSEFQKSSDDHKSTTKTEDGEENDMSLGLMGMAEDDDLKRELSDLETSEQLLRQELDQANFFSQFLLSPSGSTSYYEDSSMQEEEEESESHDLGPASEADIEQEDFDNPESNLELPPVDENGELSPKTTPAKQQSTVSENPTTPVTPRQTTTPASAKSSESTPGQQQTPLLVMGKTPVPYDLNDHKETLEIVIQNGWYMADLNRFALSKAMQSYRGDLPTIRDFCISCPENRLKTWYIGFTETSVEDKQLMPSLLPVRTSVIRIRPDVLCGAVMDAVMTSTSTLIDTEPEKIKEHSILRRQGGHLRLKVMAADDLEFLVDAQLCTQKSHQCERVLILRIFYASAKSAAAAAAKATQSSSPVKSVPPRRMNDDDAPEVCHHLMEACALVQRIEIQAANATSSSRRAIKFRPAQVESLTNRESMAQSFSKALAKQYKACPSVKEGTITLPALNSEDWQILKASSVWSEAVWEELDSRSLTYASLATTNFGSFPCLPTLDVHFCSQIRKYSRENMVINLLNYATQLEEYARDAEYACANVISLLKGAYQEYGIEPPPLPSAIPLTSYPLEYAAPQAVCPPWGLKVMEALETIQAWTGKNIPTTQFGEDLGDSILKESTQLSIRAVRLVYEAFQRQDDEEKNARLERKNHQVMDRLSFMKKHQQMSVELLDTCTADIAEAAADGMLSRTNVREVPLLRWGILANNSTGTCIVTARHLFFVTQNIPLLGSLGGSKVKTFNMKNDIDSFELIETTSSIFPSMIVIEKDGKEVFSFRPNVGAIRFKKFLDILQSIASENQSILSS